MTKCSYLGDQWRKFRQTGFQQTEARWGMLNGDGDVGDAPLVGGGSWGGRTNGGAGAQGSAAARARAVLGRIGEYGEDTHAGDEFRV